MHAVPDHEPKTIYWHRELPPLDAELMAEHTVEANSSLVTGSLAYGGHYAHVLDEAIAPAHSATSGEAWLHGRFTYALYRRPTA